VERKHGRAAHVAKRGDEHGRRRVEVVPGHRRDVPAGVERRGDDRLLEHIQRGHGIREGPEGTVRVADAKRDERHDRRR
jgi:hypothetical protein